MRDWDKKLLHKTYREISEQLGIEAAVKLRHMFGGTQINFPVRLYDPNCVRELILKEYNGQNVRELARKYDYSEKTIRRIIRQKES